jgi:ABC-2 type transport system permease protein
VGILSHGALISYALAGGLIAILAMNGISLAAAIAPMKTDYMYKDMIVASRSSPMDFMFGELLAQLLWTAPSVLLFLGLDAYFGLLTSFSLLITLFVGVLIMLITTSIAFWISSLMKNTVNVWPLGIILSVVLITISPTFYPATYLPKNVLHILELLPTTSAAVIEQGVFNLTPMVWYPLLILVIEAIGFLLVARYLTKWKED